MKFGTFHILPMPEGTTAHDVIHETLKEVDLAESMGFNTVWLAEHHSSRFGLCASASVLGAAVAMRTQRVKIGYAVNVTPLHHPLRLAEEVAFVDQLSNGRVIAGFGPGYAPYEFDLYGVPLDERHERHREGTEIVMKAWREEKFSYHGQYYDFDNVSVLPKPYQRPHPPIAIAAGSPASVIGVAKSALRLLLLVASDQIDNLLKVYREAAAAAGQLEAEVSARLAHTGVMRTIYVADDDDEARRLAREHSVWLVRMRNQLAFTEVTDKQVDEQVSEFLAQRMIAGCPERVVDEINYVAEVGGGEILGWFRWGGMAHREVTASMRLFADRVMPRVS